MDKTLPPRTKIDRGKAPQLKAIEGSQRRSTPGPQNCCQPTFPFVLSTFGNIQLQVEKQPFQSRIVIPTVHDFLFISTIFFSLSVIYNEEYLHDVIIVSEYDIFS